MPVDLVALLVTAPAMRPHTTMSCARRSKQNLTQEPGLPAGGDKTYDKPAHELAGEGEGYRGGGRREGDPGTGADEF